MATSAEIVAAARAEGSASLRNIPAIAIRATLLEGHSPTDPATLTKRCMTIEPVVHPVLEAHMDASGAHRQGRATWSWGHGTADNPGDDRPMLAALRTLAEGQLITDQQAHTTKGPKELWNARVGGSSYLRQAVGYSTPSGNALNHFRTAEVAAYQRANPDAPRYQYVTIAHERAVEFPHAGDLSPLARGFASVSSDGGRGYLKVRTHFLQVPSESDLPDVRLNLLPAGRAAIEPKVLRGAEAAAILDWLEEEGFLIVDESEDNKVGQLREAAASSVVIWPQRGRPAEAQASVGRLVAPEIREALGVEGFRSDSATTACVDIVASQLAEIQAILEERGNAVDDGIADVARLTLAESHSDDRLRDYQQVMVGLHLSTKLGLVNALPPGMGKTITTECAMNARAFGIEGKLAPIPGYRALIVCEANVRDQWREETANNWWTGRVFVLDTGSQHEELAAAHEAAGDEPLMIVTSYALASKVASLEVEASEESDEEEAAEETPAETPAVELVDKRGQGMLFNFNLDDTIVTAAPAAAEEEVDARDPLAVVLDSMHWHDIAVDEADLALRNSGSRIAKALRRLRQNADVAVALTGTPIVRSLDDIGRMLAWVRNDPELFDGARLDKVFDVSDPEQLEAYLRAIGPLVFRRDKSEVSDEIPALEPLVVPLEPSAQERALAHAARETLREAYEELLSFMLMRKEMEPDNPELEAIQEALVAARGAWLGGTTLARQATSDPAALLGSQSAAAALLASQGLIDAAVAYGGTKRRWVLGLVRDKVAEGKPVLIFTQFATVANAIIEDITDAGFRVSGILGGGGKARDEAKRAFAKGELDVIVATQSGQRGMNLQAAGVLVHFDLPWTPDQVIQRTGRVERIGSEHDKVEVYFPIMSGTIEERVAGIVVARAVTSMLALDSSRGVQAVNTDMGRALGGLALDVDASVLEGKDAKMLAMTQALLAA